MIILKENLLNYKFIIVLIKIFLYQNWHKIILLLCKITYFFSLLLANNQNNKTLFVGCNVGSEVGYEEYQIKYNTNKNRNYDLLQK